MNFGLKANEHVMLTFENIYVKRVSHQRQSLAFYSIIESIIESIIDYQLLNQLLIWMIFVLGSCCGTCGTRKPFSHAPLYGIEGFRTEEIEVNTTYASSWGCEIEFFTPIVGFVYKA